MARTTKKRPSRKKPAPRRREPAVLVRNRPLRDLTEDALRRYFKDLNGHKPGALYDLVLGEVEPPLLRTVMDYTEGNQSQAAEILGINRKTLYRKLE